MIYIFIVRASLVAQMVKRLPTMQETRVRSLGSGRSPGEGNGNPLQYSCLEKSHGRRSQVGYSPWGCKESDTTERLHFIHCEKFLPGTSLVVQCLTLPSYTGCAGSIPGWEAKISHASRPKKPKHTTETILTQIQ